MVLLTLACTRKNVQTTTIVLGLVVVVGLIALRSTYDDGSGGKNGGDDLMDGLDCQQALLLSLMVNGRFFRPTVEDFNDK